MSSPHTKISNDLDKQYIAREMAIARKYNLTEPPINWPDSFALEMVVSGVSQTYCVLLHETKSRKQVRLQKKHSLVRIVYSDTEYFINAGGTLFHQLHFYNRTSNDRLKIFNDFKTFFSCVFIIFKLFAFTLYFNPFKSYIKLPNKTSEHYCR